MKKQQSISSLKSKLDRVFSEFIRLRDADDNGYIRCYCCGKVLHWKEAQNMHFIPRQHMNLRYSEANCHAGCVKCNYYNNGNIEAYTVRLKKDYGEDIVEKLLVSKMQSRKISALEYDVMIDYYQQRVNELKKKKGL